MFLVGKWLLLSFGQSYAENGLHLLWILSISCLPIGINYLYATILQVTHRIKELVTIRGVTAIAVLVTSYSIMSSTGIIGIGYAWLIAQSITAIYITFRIRPLLRS